MKMFLALCITGFVLQLFSFVLYPYFSRILPFGEPMLWSVLIFVIGFILFACSLFFVPKKEKWILAVLILGEVIWLYATIYFFRHNFFIICRPGYTAEKVACHYPYLKFHELDLGRGIKGLVVERKQNKNKKYK